MRARSSAAPSPELAGATHVFPQAPTATVNRSMGSWFTRWVDGDTRSTPFICVATPSGASQYRNPCPQ